MTFNPDPKITTPRDPAHLAFIRCFGCIACGRPADAHHQFGSIRGTSSKSSDLGTIPLCRVHHTELHQIGRARFEGIYRVNLMEVEANLLHYRLTGQPLTMHLTILRDFEEYLVV